METRHFCFFGYVIVLLQTRTTTVKNSTKTMCTLTPSGNCNINRENGSVTLRLPDGPLRSLPGTVRNLSLLVENKDWNSVPIIRISWKPPKVLAPASVYKVYIVTWDNAVLPDRSTIFPYVHVVSTYNTSQIDKVDLRVSSTLFRGLNDITVFVNTWVDDRSSCFIRQAKAVFYTMASLPFTSKHWKYHVTMSIPKKGVVRISFLPNPNASIHDLTICTKKHADLHRPRCQKRLLEEAVSTATFEFRRIHCVTFQITIIPIPNPHREMFRIDRFVPALQCSVCEDSDSQISLEYTTDPVEMYHVDSHSDLSNDQLKSEMVDKLHPKTRINTRAILGASLASVVGLAVCVVFVVIRLRTKQRNDLRRLPQTDIMEMEENAAAGAPCQTEKTKQRQFWDAVSQADEKTVCLVYTEDSQCHAKVVREFARYLQIYFKCVIFPVDWSRGIEQQLLTSQTAIVVESEVLTGMLAIDITVTRRNPVSSDDNTSRTDKMSIGHLLKDVFKNNMLVVRFPYTNIQNTTSTTTSVNYNIPDNLYDLLCTLHDLNVGPTGHPQKLSPECVVTVDLQSAIDIATVCHGTFSHHSSALQGSTPRCACAERQQSLTYRCESVDDSFITYRSDDNEFVFRPPTPVSEYSRLDSVSRELLYVSQQYEYNSIPPYGLQPHRLYEE